MNGNERSLWCCKKGNKPNPGEGRVWRCCGALLYRNGTDRKKRYATGRSRNSIRFLLLWYNRWAICTFWSLSNGMILSPRTEKPPETDPTMRLFAIIEMKGWATGMKGSWEASCPGLMKYTGSQSPVERIDGLAFAWRQNSVWDKAMNASVRWNCRQAERTRFGYWCGSLRPGLP